MRLQIANNCNTPVLTAHTHPPSPCFQRCHRLRLHRVASICQVMRFLYVNPQLLHTAPLNSSIYSTAITDTVLGPNSAINRIFFSGIPFARYPIRSEDPKKEVVLSVRCSRSHGQAAGATGEATDSRAPKERLTQPKHAKRKENGRGKGN